MSEQAKKIKRLEAELAEAKANHRIALVEFYDLAALYSPLVIKYEALLTRVAELEKLLREHQTYQTRQGDKAAIAVVEGK